MPLLLAALAALGLWLWLRARKRPVPAQWIAIAGALLGPVMAARGMPLLGALMTAGSGLWLQFGPSRGTGGAAPPPSPPDASRRDPDRTEAAALLGISPEADRDTVLDAHRRLIARNHPDAGGTAALAARINAARDVLLKSQPD